MRQGHRAEHMTATDTSVSLWADLSSGLPPATCADLLSDNRTSV